MEIFMIHLCTIATLMFLQNNTSQKILFIAARTIQFPGVVFKVCIYLIVAIVTSSIYFDVKSTHTYRKYIYQQSVSLRFSILSSIFPDIFNICNHASLNYHHFRRITYREHGTHHKAFLIQQNWVGCWPTLYGIGLDLPSSTSCLTLSGVPSLLRRFPNVLPRPEPSLTFRFPSLSPSRFTGSQSLRSLSPVTTSPWWPLLSSAPPSLSFLFSSLIIE